MLIYLEDPRVYQKPTRTIKWVCESYRTQGQYTKTNCILIGNWHLTNSTIHNSIVRMKYLEINLTKYVQDLYAENYETLINK